MKGAIKMVPGPLPQYLWYSRLLSYAPDTVAPILVSRRFLSGYDSFIYPSS